MIKHDITWWDALYIQILTYTEIETEELHEHNFDHITFIPPGSEFNLEIDGKLTRYVGPASVLISAHTKHRFRSLKPNSCHCCIHVLRDPKDWGRVLPEGAVPEGAPVWPYIAPLTEKPVK